MKRFKTYLMFLYRWKITCLCFLSGQRPLLAHPSVCWKHITWPVTNRNTTTPVEALSLTNCYFPELKPPWMDHLRNRAKSSKFSIIHSNEQLVECSSFQICLNGFGFCVLLRDRVKELTASTMSICANQLGTSWQGKLLTYSKDS